MPELIAPIVPTPDSTAARIIGSADIAGHLVQGFAAAAARAERQRALELEAQRLAQQERLAQDQHDVERERLSNVHDIASQQIEARRPVYAAQARAFDALGRWRDARQTATLKGMAGVATRNAQREQQIGDVMNQFNDRVGELDLDDPNPDNPVQFYANVQKLKDEFRYANLPDVKNALHQFDLQTQQHTIPILYGSDTKNVPVGRVIEQLNDPESAPAMWKLLKDSGHAKIETAPGEDKRQGFWQWLTQAKPSPVKINTPDDTLKPLLDMGKDVDFSHDAPVVKPGWLRSALPNTSQPASYPADAFSPTTQQAIGTTDESTPLPEAAPADNASAEDEQPQASADTSALFAPTDVDMMLQHARNAIAGGAALPDVAQRLQSMKIDPNLLWQSDQAAA